MKGLSAVMRIVVVAAAALVVAVVVLGGFTGVVSGPFQEGVNETRGSNCQFQIRQVRQGEASIESLDQKCVEKLRRQQQN